MSKSKLDKIEKTYYTNLNLHMFVEDMTSSFNISLSSLYEYHGFFYFESTDDSLKQILSYDSWNNYRDFLEYSLPEILSHMMYSLIWNGEGYLHIKRKLDEQGRLISLDFNQIEYKKVRKSGGMVSFTYDQNNTVDIPKNELVHYSLKDAGLRSNIFSNAIKKISKIDSIGEVYLLQDKNISYDFNKHHKQIEFDELVATKDTYWCFRKFDNSYLNDITLQYRLLEMKILRTKLLNYLLSVINNELGSLSRIYNFDGIIKCNAFVTIDQLVDAKQKLLDGSVSFNEINNIIYGKKMENNPDNL